MSLLSKIFVGNNLIVQQEVVDLIKADRSTIVLDVRTAAEFRNGHLTPSINIDIRDKSFQSQLKNYERDKNYVIYCRSGARSVRAYRKMKSMGFQNLFVLRKGISDWEGSKKLK